MVTNAVINYNMGKLFCDNKKFCILHPRTQNNQANMHLDIGSIIAYSIATSNIETLYLLGNIAIDEVSKTLCVHSLCLQFYVFAQDIKDLENTNAALKALMRAGKSSEQFLTDDILQKVR